MMGKLLTLKNDFLTVRVSPQGGVILDAYDNKGRAVLRPYQVDNENLSTIIPTDTACFPLLPLGNRVADSRFTFDDEEYELPVNSDADFQYIHGDGWLAKWEVKETSKDSITLRYAHQTDDSPYQYVAEQTISLMDEQLSLALSITHKGENKLPYGLGFHPYFPRTKNLRLQASSESWWVGLIMKTIFQLKIKNCLSI